MFSWRIKGGKRTPHTHTMEEIETSTVLVGERKKERGEMGTCE